MALEKCDNFFVLVWAIIRVTERLSLAPVSQVPVGRKLDKRVHLGSGSGRDLPITVQLISKWLTACERTIKVIFVVQLIRHFCSLIPKMGSSGPPVVDALQKWLTSIFSKTTEDSKPQKLRRHKNGTYLHSHRKWSCQLLSVGFKSRSRHRYRRRLRRHKIIIVEISKTTRALDSLSISTGCEITSYFRFAANCINVSIFVTFLPPFWSIVVDWCGSPVEWIWIEMSSIYSHTSKYSWWSNWKKLTSTRVHYCAKII